MNKARRKSIKEIASQLDEARGALEELQVEEEQSRDSIPENLQGSARYEASDAACEALSDAVSGLDEIIANLDELAEG